MRGDLEVYLDTCMRIQEEYSNLWEVLDLLQGDSQTIEAFDVMIKINEMMMRYYSRCM